MSAHISLNVSHAFLTRSESSKIFLDSETDLARLNLRQTKQLDRQSVTRYKGQTNMAKRNSNPKPRNLTVVAPEPTETKETAVSEVSNSVAPAPTWPAPAPTPSATSLEEIVRQCPTDNEFVYLPETVYATLSELGFIDVNPTLIDEHGWLAARPTAKGRHYVMSTSPNTAYAPVSDYVPPTPAPDSDIDTAPDNDSESMFAIDDDVAPPVQDGRSGKRLGVKYPFDKLNVGQSFFVPNTKEKPQMAKALASTVSAATAKYDRIIEGKTALNRKGEKIPAKERTRKFVIRAVDGGARIWRTE